MTRAGVEGAGQDGPHLGGVPGSSLSDEALHLIGASLAGLCEDQIQTSGKPHRLNRNVVFARELLGPEPKPLVVSASEPLGEAHHPFVQHGLKLSLSPCGHEEVCLQLIAGLGVMVFPLKYDWLNPRTTQKVPLKDAWMLKERVECEQTSHGAPNNCPVCRSHSIGALDKRDCLIRQEHHEPICLSGVRIGFRKGG